MTEHDAVMDSSVASAQRPKLYFGRFLRKQDLFGSVAVVGTVSGTTIEYITDAKRRFVKDGTVETHGVAQHAGLSPGDWVEFDVTKNTRPRAAEYKVAHIRRIPRYFELPEGGDAFYQALLTRRGWNGDRRAGRWALKLSDQRLVIAEMEVGEDGALRIPRGASKSVEYYQFRAEAVVRLDASSPDDAFYLVQDCEPTGHFDWSDEADHVARVIRSLADVDDPRVSDLIAWLELHHEEATGKVFAADVDHDAARDALRSGELAERLRADRALMRDYLDAAMSDSAVAALVAEYAREGHTEARLKLLGELEEEISGYRAQLIAEQENAMAEARKIAEATLTAEVRQLRDERLGEVEDAVQKAERAHHESMACLETEYRGRHDELKRQMEAAVSELAQLEDSIASARSDLEVELQSVEAERGRAREAAAEVDRLLSVSRELTHASSATTQASGSAVPFAFAERELASVQSVSETIDGLAILSRKGRDLLRRLVVLMRSGEVPVLYGNDAADFVRVAGQVITPGRLGFMRGDPTIVSIEDLWARPGSGTPTVLAAASLAVSRGGSAWVAVTDIESSGARFWVPALAELLRSPDRPRGILACAIARDVEHEEVKALPYDVAVLEIEGVFEAGAFYGALTLPGVAGTSQVALDPGETPPVAAAAARCIADLGFEPSVGLAMRIARIFSESAAMLGDEVAAAKLTVTIAQDINNKNY